MTKQVGTELVESEVQMDEFCRHCWAKIDGRYRNCPFCGKVWYLIDDKICGADNDTERGERTELEEDVR